MIPSLLGDLVERLSQAARSEGLSLDELLMLVEHGWEDEDWPRGPDGAAPDRLWRERTMEGLIVDHGVKSQATKDGRI